MYNPPLDGLDGPNVLALYDEGLPFAVIAGATGRSEAAVRRYAIRHGGHMSDRAQPLPPPARYRQLKHLESFGLTNEAMAEALGVSVPVVKRARRGRGVRRRTPIQDQEHAHFLSLWLAGGNVRGIATATRRAWKSVRDSLVAAGVYEPRPNIYKPAPGHPWRGVDYRRR